MLATATTAATQKGAHNKSELIDTFHNLAFAFSEQADFTKPTIHMPHNTTVEVDNKRPTASSMKYKAVLLPCQQSCSLEMQLHCGCDYLPSIALHCYTAASQTNTTNNQQSTNSSSCKGMNNSYPCLSISRQQYQENAD